MIKKVKINEVYTVETAAEWNERLSKDDANELRDEIQEDIKQHERIAHTVAEVPLAVLRRFAYMLNHSPDPVRYRAEVVNGLQRIDSAEEFCREFIRQVPPREYRQMQRREAAKRSASE